MGRFLVVRPLLADLIQCGQVNKKNMETNQQIIGAITNIKVAGIATMSYWSILKTLDAVYFVKSGTALGLGVGTNSFLLLASVVGDIVESSRAKKLGEKDLATILKEAEQSLRFTKEQYHLLKIQQRIFGGCSIKIPNGKEKSWAEAGYVKLKLSRKNFKIFLEMVKS